MENTFIQPELFLAGNFLFRIIPMQPTATPIRNTCNRHLNDTEQQERFHSSSDCFNKNRLCFLAFICLRPQSGGIADKFELNCNKRVAKTTIRINVIMPARDSCCTTSRNTPAGRPGKVCYFVFYYIFSTKKQLLSGFLV